MVDLNDTDRARFIAEEAAHITLLAEEAAQMGLSRLHDFLQSNLTRVAEIAVKAKLDNRPPPPQSPFIYTLR